MLQTDSPLERGRELVVQIVETFQAGAKPTFVEELDAVQVARDSAMPVAPVMIYGDDVTHVLTEEGIAYLYKAQSLDERKAMIAAVAGVTPIGLQHDPAKTQRMSSACLNCDEATSGVTARHVAGELAAGDHQPT
jgi:malonate decarboxylase alpha subunit